MQQGADARYDTAAAVLGHLADPTRLRLLDLLRTEHDVSELTAEVTASRSSVSQHLGRLRHAGLVRARRDGRHVRYRITSEHLSALVAEVLGFADHAVLGIPHHEAPPSGNAERQVRDKTSYVVRD